jgi:hypothetical protein
LANGKGNLECYYCTHFTPSVGAQLAGPGQCAFHNAEIPASAEGLNRVCTSFVANAAFERDNAPHVHNGVKYHSSAHQRFTRFARSLEAGVLYGFFYNTPEKVRELLRFAL